MPAALSESPNAARKCGKGVGTAFAFWPVIDYFCLQRLFLMAKLFLIDAYALIFRSYYAFLGRSMHNGAGVNTAPIFGFTKFLRDIISRERPGYLGVAFDPKVPVFFI